jgi:hypothetical protein
MLVVRCRLAGVLAPRVAARALSHVTHRLFARHRRAVHVIRVGRALFVRAVRVCRAPSRASSARYPRARLNHSHVIAQVS